MADDIRKEIIVGSGPAGLTAALYSARASLAPLVFAGVPWGGQLMLTTEVENFPGFENGLLGPEMMAIFRKQAERFGAEILNENISRVDFSSSPFKVWVGEKEHRAQSVIVATGAEAVWLGIENEQKLIGKGVSSCAPCDAFFFKDKKVVVVGGGDSAMEEALTRSKFAAEVTIVHRRDEFSASKIMFDRARANEKIRFILNSQIVDVLGLDKVEGLKIKTSADMPRPDGFKLAPITSKMKAGSVVDMEIDGMFMAIGHKPITDIFRGQLDLDDAGYIKQISNFNMMTSVPGVFVAGDVHDSHYKQAITAAGFGCMAALEVEKWLEAQS